MERPTGVVVQGPMTSRPALLAVCALSLAWISIATVYLYPDLKEEVDEKRYLHRAGKLHIPVLPLECGRARGVEIETSFERTGTRKGAGRRSRSSIRSIRRSLRPLTSAQRCGPICVRASQGGWQDAGLSHLQAAVILRHSDPARAAGPEPQMPPQEDSRSS